MQEQAPSRAVSPSHGSQVPEQDVAAAKSDVLRLLQSMQPAAADQPVASRSPLPQRRLFTEAGACSAAATSAPAALADKQQQQQQQQTAAGPSGQDSRTFLNADAAAQARAAASSPPALVPSSLSVVHVKVSPAAPTAPSNHRHTTPEPARPAAEPALPGSRVQSQPVDQASLPQSRASNGKPGHAAASPRAATKSAQPEQASRPAPEAAQQELASPRSALTSPGRSRQVSSETLAAGGKDTQELGLSSHSSAERRAEQWLKAHPPCAATTGSSSKEHELGASVGLLQSLMMPVLQLTLYHCTADEQVQAGIHQADSSQELQGCCCSAPADKCACRWEAGARPHQPSSTGTHCFAPVTGQPDAAYATAPHSSSHTSPAGGRRCARLYLLLLLLNC